MTKTLAGAFPVLPTPFAADGQIDKADFASIIDFVVESNVDGVVYPGVASEVETLTSDERRSQMLFLAERLAGRLPIIIGASDSDPAVAAKHVAQGGEFGAAAAMVIAPLAIGNDVAAQIAYFKAVSAGAPVPIMLQNQPKPIGAGLLPEEVAEIVKAVPEIRYVKEETAPFGQNLTRIKNAAGDSVDAIFGGAGGRYVTDELARGAAGTMPASEIADIHALMIHAWQKGDRETTRRLYNISLPLLNYQAIFRMHLTKEVLRRRRVIKNVFVRAKGPKFDADDLIELGHLLDDADLPFTNHKIV